jgi:hypothetical protein
MCSEGQFLLEDNVGSPLSKPAVGNAVCLLSNLRSMITRRCLTHLE